MVSAAENGEVKLWRVADGQLIRVVQATGYVTAVAYRRTALIMALGERPIKWKVKRSPRATAVAGDWPGAGRGIPGVQGPSGSLPGATVARRY